MVKNWGLEIYKCVGCQLCMFACSRRFGDGGFKSVIRVSQSEEWRGVSPSSCAEPAQTAVHEGFIREGVEEFFRLL